MHACMHARTPPCMHACMHAVGAGYLLRLLGLLQRPVGDGDHGVDGIAGGGHRRNQLPDKRVQAALPANGADQPAGEGGVRRAGQRVMGGEHTCAGGRGLWATRWPLGRRQGAAEGTAMMSTAATRGLSAHSAPRSGLQPPKPAPLKDSQPLAHFSRSTLPGVGRVASLRRASASVFCHLSYVSNSTYDMAMA